MPQSDNKDTTDSPPAIDVHLDVLNIEVTCAFWCDKLGFEPVGEVRMAGTFLEIRSVERHDLPGYRFTFHCCAPSPAAGSWKGSLKRICLRVADLDETARRIGDDAPWVVTPQEARADAAPLRVLDPNGYQIELRGDPRAGS